jgi:hypothetical protein
MLFFARGGAARSALALGDDHRHDLPAAGDQVAEKTIIFIL